MSAILESVLDDQRRADCLAHDVALAQAMFPKLEPARKRKAFSEHMDLAEVGERVEIVAVSDSFPIAAARHQLAEAQLRERA